MNEFLPIISRVKDKEYLQELQELNLVTAAFGLSLSLLELQELELHRASALKSTGRIEFGRGILDKLILSFCDSPYIFKDSYLEALIELQDIFYYFKNQGKDRLSDNHLLEAMKAFFNGQGGGSLEYLSSLSIDDLLQYQRMEEAY